jgi:signal peptidase
MKKLASDKIQKDRNEKDHMRLYVGSSVFLAIAVSVCLIFTVQVVTRGYVQIAGYSIFRVVTGSMEPTIPTGAVLVNQKTDIADIQVGDVICYRAKIQEIYGSVVTHRVVNITEDENQNILLETRGDANAVSDPYYVERDDLVGRVIWYTGRESTATNILSFINGKIGFLACIALPVLLLSGILMQGAVRSLRKEINQAMYELSQQSEDQRDAEERLPGYTTLTYKDYQELYESLKKEFTEERYDQSEGTDCKME